jgi:nucleotide-binding universal stress UspA family protein
MRPIKRILTTTMFTPASHVAVMFAARLAADLDASLMLLHVATFPNEMIGVVPGATVAEETETVRGLVEKQMATLAGEIRAAGVAQMETLIDFSNNVPQRIMARALATCADLIVIATHGRGGVPRMVLGSVADVIVREASCPVLTIRPY